MSIANRVHDAIERMDGDNYEGALNDICGAIEDTAAREYGKGGRANYKRFVHDNLLLITRTAGISGGIANLYFDYRHPEIELDANGHCTFEQIVYHAIRCGLYHAGQLPLDLQFAPEKVIGRGKGSNVLITGSSIHLTPSMAHAAA